MLFDGKKIFLPNQCGCKDVLDKSYMEERFAQGSVFSSLLTKRANPLTTPRFSTI